MNDSQMTFWSFLPGETKAFYFFLRNGPRLKRASETPTINLHFGHNSVRPGEKADDYPDQNYNFIELQIFHQDWKSKKY